VSQQQPRRWPWPAGAATAAGSLPGVDPDEAIRTVFGELPLLPFLPELPDRGPGGAMIGRTGALLAELPVEIAPSGWRLTSHPGRDMRRARDFLAWDLDALERHAADHDGALKLQLVGPWTLAASLELPSGNPVVADSGATRDLAQSLADGLRSHLAEVQRRLPSASLVVQLDEPSLPAVLAGRIKTPSGFGTVRSVERAVVGQALRDVLDVIAPGSRAVHCCAADVPLDLVREAGADAVSIDVAHVTDLDALGEAVEAGCSLWLGTVPGVDGPVSLDAARGPIERIWTSLGFAREQLPERVVPTTACGLAGASPQYVRRALAVLRDTGRAILESE